MEKNKNNDITKFIKKMRKEYGITQEEFALRTGLGLRFIRELEQGKQTLRLDKVNQALNAFDYVITIRKKNENE